MQLRKGITDAHMDILFSYRQKKKKFSILKSYLTSVVLALRGSRHRNDASNLPFPMSVLTLIAEGHAEGASFQAAIC